MKPFRTLHSELLSMLSRSLTAMRYVGSRLSGDLNQAFLVYVSYTKIYIFTIDYETMKQTQRARSYLCGLDRNTNMQWPRQRIAEVISGVECKISHVEFRWGDRLRDLWIRGSQSLPSNVQFSSFAYWNYGKVYGEQAAVTLVLDQSARQIHLIAGTKDKVKTN